MTWTYRLPLKLLTLVRTFTLTSHAGITRLTVQDTARCHLRRLLPNLNPPLSDFVEEVKFRAEPLSFHLNGGTFPATNEAERQDSENLQQN